MFEQFWSRPDRVLMCALWSTDFRSMFPEERLSELTVVSVTQRTQNDMTAWSAQVEQERLEMLDKVSGFWRLQRSWA